MRRLQQNKQLQKVHHKEELNRINNCQIGPQGRGGAGGDGGGGGDDDPDEPDDAGDEGDNNNNNNNNLFSLFVLQSLCVCFIKFTICLYPCPMLRERDRKSQIDYTQVVLSAP